MKLIILNKVTFYKLSFQPLKISIISYLAETPERPECPKDFRILEKCNYPQNVECTTGQECCCGKCHPSMIALCSGGKWMGYYTHACMLPSCGKSKMVKIQLR